MAITSPLVELRDIHKSFGQNHVLRGVSLGLNKGTILAVMGGSGTGKTVLLRIAAGLVRRSCCVLPGLPALLLA